MLQFRTVFATGGLILALLTGMAAQVREPRANAAPAARVITGRVEIETQQQRTPVRWAKITLSTNAGGQSWTTTSDRDGRYRFDGVVTGDYRLLAEKPGFVTATIDVHSTTTAAADLLMQRGGAIEGRFVDDRAEGIARLSVTAERLAGSTDGRTPGSYAAVTDDLGRFRIHSLPPGQYRVYATPPPPASGERMFYPGTADPAQAIVIAVVAGETRDGADVTVAASPLSPIATETLAAAEREAESAPEEPGFTGRVSGRLSIIETGQPIVDASVQIVSTPGAIRSIRYNARTDGDGRFEFRRLATGVYTVSATANGFITADGSLLSPQGTGTQVMVKDGERNDRANIEMRRTSSIESRVFDEFGDPAPGVVVQVAQRVAAFGIFRFRPDSSGAFISTGATDDRGWFRVTGLFPGDYYLIAIPDPFERSSPGFDMTYFPGITSADAAQAVHIIAGTDALNATFKLVPAKTMTLSGVATDADGRPLVNPRVVLVPTDNGEIRVMVTATATGGPDGTFSFPHVPEGTYIVQAFVTGPAVNMFGSSHVTVAPVANEEPRPIALMLSKASTVRGRVTFVGGTPPPAPNGVIVAFQATDFASGPLGGPVVGSRMSTDGTFEILGFPQRGVLRVNTPPGWALARILDQARDITNVPYDFPTSDSSGLEIVLTNRVGSVSGTVVKGGKPVAEATVLVFAADGEGWWMFVQSLRPSRTNAQGGFSLSGLAPGRYLAVAVQSLGPIDDPATFAALRSIATLVLVSEGANATVQLQIVK